MIDKHGIEEFKCEECGGNLGYITWEKQHRTKKHRARSEDDADDKEEKKARMEEEL